MKMEYPSILKWSKVEFPLKGSLLSLRVKKKKKHTEIEDTESTIGLNFRHKNRSVCICLH